MTFTEKVASLKVAMASFVLPTSFPKKPKKRKKNWKPGKDELVSFPPIMNMSTGLLGTHWASIACRRRSRGSAFLYPSALYVLCAAKYSPVKLKSRRMQRKFAKAPDRYISREAAKAAHREYMLRCRTRNPPVFQDMVPVKPMPGPSIGLQYLDIQYDNSTPWETGVVEVSATVSDRDREIKNYVSTQ